MRKKYLGPLVVWMLRNAGIYTSMQQLAQELVVECFDRSMVAVNCQTRIFQLESAIKRIDSRVENLERRFFKVEGDIMQEHAAVSLDMAKFRGILTDLRIYVGKLAPEVKR